LKRNPRKSKWTKAFRKSHGKELAVDSTFEFERRRNTPVQYDRELMAKSLSAMKRVQEIKKQREERFYRARMRGKGGKEKELALKDLKTGIDLVSSSLVREKEQIQQTVEVKAAEMVDDAEDAPAEKKQAAPKKKAVKKKSTKKKKDASKMED
jgi:large subunit ribosomal protein L24e